MCLCVYECALLERWCIFCVTFPALAFSCLFDIIKDKRIRSILRKGPKYRIPSLNDFDTCRNHISEALKNYSSKWCCREHAEPNALLNWKKAIFDIIDTRISFYKSNNHLLPT